MQQGTSPRHRPRVLLPRRAARQESVLLCKDRRQRCASAASKRADHAYSRCHALVRSRQGIEQSADASRRPQCGCCQFFSSTCGHRSCGHRSCRHRSCRHRSDVDPRQQRWIRCCWRAPSQCRAGGGGGGGRRRACALIFVRRRGQRRSATAAAGDASSVISSSASSAIISSSASAIVVGGRPHQR